MTKICNNDSVNSIAKKNTPLSCNNLNGKYKNNSLYYEEEKTGVIIITNPGVINSLSATEKQILNCLLATGEAKIVEGGEVDC